MPGGKDAPGAWQAFDRKPIYSTGYFRYRCGKRARENMAYEYALLTACGARRAARKIVRDDGEEKEHAKTI
ncbi:MAG: hypothetical protein LBE06_01805 [Azoarcus sp.]|jgi:hypothetical protein|nr:hypothetical protein [Azoarcus sp.]